MGRPHGKKIKGKKQPGNGVKEAALRLLSFRAHAEKELRRKLVKKGFPAIEIAAITEKLKKLGYLDDRVFSKILAASRSKNKNWGRIKIAAELRDKGIERDIIQEAIGGLGPKEERESARNAFEKWSAAKGKARPLQKNDLVRAIRHLCARGFSQSIALCAARQTNGAAPASTPCGAGKDEFEEFIDESE